MVPARHWLKAKGLSAGLTPAAQVMAEIHKCRQAQKAEKKKGTSQFHGRWTSSICTLN
jgi:hypothetical protein